MNWLYTFNGLQFNDDFLFHEKISPKTFVKNDFLKTDWYRNLPLNRQTPVIQLFGSITS